MFCELGIEWQTSRNSNAEVYELLWEGISRSGNEIVFLDEEV